MREDAVLPRLDARLGSIIDPANLEASVAALAAVDGDKDDATEIKRCRRALADFEQRLARYRDLVTVLSKADGADRAGLYTALGLHLRYEPDRRCVLVDCRPESERLGKGRVGGGI